MSVSDINRKYLLRGVICLGAAVFCMIFARVYGMFSHGVTSFFMTCLYLPCIADSTLQFLLFLVCRNRFSRLGDNLIHSGAGTLSLGFLLQGIFEIAGTDSPFIYVFFVLGGLLAAAGIAVLLLPAAKEEER